MPKTALQEVAVGPMFVAVEDEPFGEAGENGAGSFMVDITQVVAVRQIYGRTLSYEMVLRGDTPEESMLLGEKGAKDIMEKMKHLNPVCNHCGQGHMACDHCGAPLQQVS